MKISYNAAAMHANNALNLSDNKVAQSLRRLSSGLKVTAAKENPSGYAIGRRMDAQIGGVAVATQNSNRGISIIETADGALTEVHEMLQRMNELAVKGAHGVLTEDDRAMLDAELQQLKEEVTRIAQDTEFNGQTLLDGTFDLRGYTNNDSVKVGYYGDDVLAKKYTVDSLQLFYGADGKIDLDAVNASFVPGDGFPPGVQVTSVGENSITITDKDDFELTLDITGELAARGGMRILPENTDIEVLPGSRITVDNFQIRLIQAEYGPDGNIRATRFQSGDGNSPDYQTSLSPDGVLTITRNSMPDFCLMLRLPERNPGETFKVENFTIENYPTLRDLEIDLTGIGSMDIQTGANEGQQLAIRIPTISLRRLGIENADVKTEASSTDAIDAIKGAIQYVSDTRSRLGAYQNRLEHTVSNLDVTTENMTSAYSRIMDVDMAEEMTAYTTQQVISQAATSMLAQANERPSQVLQLLQ